MKLAPTVGFVVLAMTLSLDANAQDKLSSAFGPGEQITYEISYLGVTAGSAQVMVGAEMKQWGRDVWPIIALAKSESVAALYPVRDKFVTYWDHSAQKTIGNDLFADENRKRRRERIRFDAEAQTAVVTKQKEGGKETEEIHETNANSLDMAAAAFALRNRDLRCGNEHALPVFTGAKSFILKAKVEGKENLATSIGTREVFKVRVVTQFTGKLVARRDMFVFFTTDPSHLPVKIEAEFLLGKVVADLTSYQPGKILAMKPAVASDP